MELVVSFDEIKDVFDPVSQVNKFFCYFVLPIAYLHVYNTHECTKHVTIIKIQS